MIRKYTFGNPFNTEAVVVNLDEEKTLLPFFEVKENKEFILRLKDSDIVYGLGEQVRGINKRGWHYTNFNADNPHHHEDTRSLYGSHNFLIISGEETFGVFFDYPGRIEYDIGYKRRDTMVISADSSDMDIYIIQPEEGKYKELSIVKQFRRLIGKSYVPPMWAFGFGQSRWGYKTEDDIRQVALEYEKADIPLDSIYMDIDYMDSYKDFTVDKSKFPDLKQLSSDMKDKGIHLVPIIDAGVKIEKGYDVYEEGVAENYFCKDKNGEDFIGAVWPGSVHFPDFLNPLARDWFGGKYKVLTDSGIDGFWNDMNEPAIFYTRDRLNDTLKEMEEVVSENMGIKEFFHFTGMIEDLKGNEGDYTKFYHNVDGKMICHNDVHNIYGMNMTRAANEALNKINPDKRTLFFSRSSYIGAHRFGGIWQGDNKSWWSHILLSMQQLPALNMAGFLFIGCDTGGFGCDTTEDMMMRWVQYSLFTPLFRNHSSDGTRLQELYRFSNVKNLGEMIKIRYSLIPYLYSEFLKAYKNDEMMFKPLSFEFTEDDLAKDIDDQLLLGDSVMIAPIYKQNAHGRYVYLPEPMMLIRMRSVDDFETVNLTKGVHYIKADLNELIFFIRDGKAIPVCKTCKSTSQINPDTIKLMGFKDATYEQYFDDGISSDLSRITVKTIGNNN